ncbi:AlpA family phage regulatory protein [Paraburkholderia dipogonis]|uniref:AlpA family phage regulatory protein n=1 Tax=Paraburkholderia dipogonis TaxID=1211383 RepID=A0A4Y8NAY5_9BURK|nr:AlpA family phage regulatory protein [Paraburkholderia dipogonis]TFE46926.1 AlpA family phage regulatory protein [Paraburkholderia dipogonis]
MTNKILRLRDVMQIVGVGKTSIYQWMKLGSFPRQVRLGSRAIGWHAQEIEAWLVARKQVGVD